MAVVEEPWLRLLPGCTSVYELAASAIQSRWTLREVIERLNPVETLNYDEVYSGRSGWRLLVPIDHPEPSRCYVTGTGLTHKGRQRAGSRCTFRPGRSDRQPEDVSDWPGGRLARAGVRCRGAGTVLQGHGGDLAGGQRATRGPSFGDDGGDEAEIAGVYLIGNDGAAFRIGLTQGNEFSDHRMEAKNYLYWCRRNCGPRGARNW